MVVKLRVSWLSCFLFAVLLLHAAVPVLAAERGILFRIEYEGLKPSYLLGTMHSEDPRILETLDKLQQPLQEIGLLVLEMVPNMEARQSMAKAMRLVPGERLPQVLGEALYQETQQAWRVRGLQEAILPELKPWAVALILTMPASESGLFLDLKLYQIALEREIPVQGLETARQQIDVLDQLSIQQQKSFLRAALKNLSNLPRQMEEMTDAYLDSDLQRLADLSEDQQLALDEDLNYWFDTVVVAERNLRMWQGMQSVLQQGGAMIAVGALHLVGSDGILNRLGQSGYRLITIH